MSDFQPLEDQSNLIPPCISIYINQRLPRDLTMGVLRQKSGISSLYFQIQIVIQAMPPHFPTATPPPCHRIGLS